MNIRGALRELMGKENVTDDDVRRELDELKIDQRIDALTRDGHLSADPVIQQLARAAVTGKASADHIEQLLRSPRPTPAVVTTVTPATAPDAMADPTEAAIQAEIVRSGEPYHVAASVVAAGGALVGGQ